MSRPRYPGWAKRALQEFMVKQGISVLEALRQVVVVPVDTVRGKREIPKGEKHPLSVFIGKRSAQYIAASPETKQMIVERTEAHRREMLVKGEEIDRVLAAQLKMMSQGVRPVLNAAGKAVKNKDGEQEVERLPAAVHVQALNAAGQWVARLSPQKVEMEHSGAIDIGKLSPEELEARREALIAKAAGRVAG